MCNRVLQVFADDLVHALVQRRREQQSLTALRGQFQEALNRRQESKVGHVVGFVQNGDLNKIQFALTIFDQVFQATRARDDDVYSVAEGVDLRSITDAAVHRGNAHAYGLGQRRNHVSNLLGKFTGGQQNQCARRVLLAWCGRFQQRVDQGQREGQSLARTSASTTKDVASLQGVRKRGGLDRKRGNDAVECQALNECIWHSQVGKARLGICWGRRN